MDLAATLAELEQERQRARLIATFFEDAARSGADDRSVFQALVDHVGQAIGDTCVVYLVSEDGAWLELAGYHDLDETRKATTVDAIRRRRIGGTLYAGVIGRGEPLFLPVMDAEDLGPATAEFSEEQRSILRRQGPHSVLAVPVLLERRVAGVLAASRIETPSPYTSADLETVRSLAARASVVIDNARARRALKSASERLTTIIAESPIATAVLDRDWNVQSWNRASEQLFGWASAEIVGRPLPTKPSDIIDAEHDLRTRVNAGEIVQNLESRSRDRDGRDIAVSLYAAPLREDGQIIGAVLRWIDLTERQQLEGQLQQAQRLESVGRLAGGIAHDFNNILTAILGFAGLIVEDLPEGDPRRANAQAIEEAAQRATDLVRQLLAFGRQQVFRLEVVDIAEVVTRLSPMLQRLIGEDVTVTVVSPETPWPVEADRSQLEQVIVNLAVNARDAMPRGGRLTIEIANVDLNEQYAETHAEVTPGPHVMLAVSDTGTGMDAETTSRIFEPFFTTKEAGRGTGLGLSTVYGIVRQSGGHIWVYSELGRGSTFRLYFPRATTQAATTEPPRAVPQAVTGTETILVAEDEEILRALIDVILRRLGYTVLLAPNGQAAMQIARERPIDLLLTDVVMPGQSGFELAAAIREVAPNTPVLMMSGYTSAALEPHGLVEGDDLLQKPFTPDTLGQAVRARLSRSA